MTIQGKKILLISPEPWDHIFVSKHNYAINLAELGAEVYFANPPANKWSLDTTKYENLKVLSYPNFLPGIRFLPTFISAFIIKKKLKAIEKFIGIKFDIIWSFDNSVFFDFNLINAFCISHIVDLNQNFELKKASETADLCLYSSNAIGRKLHQHNPNSHFINHGYHSIRKKKPLFIPEYKGIKIGYAGNLNLHYIDWKALTNAFEKLEEVNFYLAGPILNSNVLSEYKNVNLLGTLASEEIESFYEQMDILILCYKADEYPDQLSNPHKMMEYLASEKPIVCTYTENYVNLDSICMAKDQSAWMTTLQEAIGNIDYWNSIELRKKRKETALTNTYKKQIHRIEKLIFENED